MPSFIVTSAPSVIFLPNVLKASLERVLALSPNIDLASALPPNFAATPAVNIAIVPAFCAVSNASSVACSSVNFREPSLFVAAIALA